MGCEAVLMCAGLLHLQNYAFSTVKYCCIGKQQIWNFIIL